MQASELAHLEAVLFMDLEFTCWEGSVQSGWSQPARPAEIIEIGLAVCELPCLRVVAVFDSLVRPRLNPVLSPYCVELLGIDRGEVARAGTLPSVLTKLCHWVQTVGLKESVPTCAWGVNDRMLLAADAGRSGCADPFAGRGHLDLQSMLRRLTKQSGPGGLSREEARATFRLAENRHRHRALADALDLLQFCRLLLGPRHAEGRCRRG